MRGNFLWCALHRAFHRALWSAGDAVGRVSNSLGDRSAELARGHFIAGLVAVENAAEMRQADHGQHRLPNGRAIGNGARVRPIAESKGRYRDSARRLDRTCRHRRRREHRAHGGKERIALVRRSGDHTSLLWDHCRQAIIVVVGAVGQCEGDDALVSASGIGVRMARERRADHASAVSEVVTTASRER